jgi:DNA-binding transcriptional regulator YiaG
VSIGDNKILLDNVRRFGFDKFGSMKGLADAMGVRPQNLNSYLSGKVAIGPKYIARLKMIGFDSDNISSASDSSKKCYTSNYDISGAVELTGISIDRLAKLLQVSRADLLSWEKDGKEPSPEQSAALFNQVVALALARATERNTQELSEKQVVG